LSEENGDKQLGDNRPNNINIFPADEALTAYERAFAHNITTLVPIAKATPT
jgi:hypothetical protein